MQKLFIYVNAKIEVHKEPCTICRVQGSYAIMVIRVTKKKFGIIIFLQLISREN